MAPLRYAIYYEHKQECEAAATGILRFQCPTCGMKFVTSKQNGEHQRTCNPKKKRVIKSKPKPYYCTYEGCDFKATRKERIENHVNEAHLGLPKIKRYSCETCGKAYVMKSMLKDHIKQNHSDVRDYHCSDCGSSFATSTMLRNHQLIHSDIPTQICPFCSKGFKQSSVLYRHKLSCPMNPNK